MIEARIRRHKTFLNKLKYAGTKSGKVGNYIITGIGVHVPGTLEDPALYGEIETHQDEIIPIYTYKEGNNRVIDVSKEKKVNVKSKRDYITFNDWFRTFHSDEEMKDVFLNMDLAMKFIHNKNYCIKSFDPDEIHILNNSINNIKFNTLLKMPREMYDRKELIKEDIYSSAFLQVGAYMNNVSTKGYEDQTIEDFLLHMRPDFLKDNFDSFTTFLPEEDIPYYRGVIQRGNSVYYSDFEAERKKRDLIKLEKEFGDEGGNSNTNTRSKAQERGKSLVKKTAYGFGNYDDQNSINEKIYSQITTADAAFVTKFVLPLLMIIGGVLLMLVAYFVSR